MEKVLKVFFCLLAVTLSLSVNAQSGVEMADTLRSEGKIYVVVSIILIVLAGLIAYLFIMDRKVKKLEDQLTEKER
jgi:protein-S-isoprenylcysteine O-methyltransferase Ste14